MQIKKSINSLIYLKQKKYYDWIWRNKWNPVYTNNKKTKYHIFNNLSLLIQPHI